MSDSPLTVNCPQCHEIVAWTEENRWRPFCSERCKLLDFGDWASERHSIPGEPAAPEDLETALLEGRLDPERQPH
ncbi:MAG: DNA gyrase inhibitor YacG [Pseudomonadota bacterium]